MHVSSKDLLLALAIGAEVSAIAALWPLSEWALKKPRRWAFAAAMGVGMPERHARAAALFVAAVAVEVEVAPVATLVAGCGLAGACL